MNCPWKGRPGKNNLSGLSEVAEGGETFAAVSSRMVTSDCIRTLSVRVRHQNSVVHGGGENSALVEWRVLRRPPATSFPSGVLVPALQLVSYWFLKRLSGLTIKP